LSFVRTALTISATTSAEDDTFVGIAPDQKHRGRDVATNTAIPALDLRVGLRSIFAIHRCQQFLFRACPRHLIRSWLMDSPSSAAAPAAATAQAAAAPPPPPLLRAAAAAACLPLDLRLDPVDWMH
jgi:hypothetical protein